LLYVYTPNFNGLAADSRPQNNRRLDRVPT